MFPVLQNWETLEKHARAMTVPGNIHRGMIMLPRFIETDTRQAVVYRERNFIREAKKRLCDRP